MLDEPTTGLHFADVEKLLGVINGLVDKGNTVIVIEHNLDVIKTADHVIDMGPEGGSGGGLVIAEGTPEEIAAHPDSYTGQFLGPVLAGRGVAAAQQGSASKAGVRSVGQAPGRALVAKTASGKVGSGKAAGAASSAGAPKGVRAATVNGASRNGTKNGTAVNGGRAAASASASTTATAAKARRKAAKLI